MKHLLYIILLSGCGLTYGQKYETIIPGPEGKSSVISIVYTSSCANGGYTILTAIDENKNYVLDGADSNIQSREVCNGTPGLDGTPGTIVTPIKFCQGQNTNYPNSFPEYGLCINNTIYAVYWMNGQSWMGQAPAGNYSTTNTGLTCNFTITDNCNIQ